MHKILDKTKERKIMDTIEKSNETYQEFEINKKEEKIAFQQNQYFSIQGDVEEDPKTIQKRLAEMEEDN